MPSAIAPPSSDTNKAPTFTVPPSRIISIEHPCIVKDLENGLKSLGGEHQLKHVLSPSHDNEDVKPSVNVSFRPQDPFAKRISSTLATTHNVLVKVTVPKRTGRKRKRGSDEPFDDSSSCLPECNTGITATDLLRRLRDNPDTYTIQPVGIIEDTHRFENLPDFQVRASEVPIMQEIHTKVMTSRYEDLKAFDIDSKYAADTIAAFPGPPSFTPTAQPFDWQDALKVPSETPARPRKRKVAAKALAKTVTTALDSAQVPQQPLPGNLENVGSITLQAIEAVRQLMGERPIITIRAACAILSDHTMKAISWAIRYLGYYVSNGPWKGTMVKYGVDPRSDPKYRFYQTLNFNIAQMREINAVLGKQGHGTAAQSHIFDGERVSEIGKLWQLCDLTDPFITQLVNAPENAQAQCDNDRFGWYANGVIAKIRVLLREKMVRVINGEAVPGNEYFTVLDYLPNQFNDYADGDPGGLWSSESRQLARDVAKEALKGPPKSYWMLKNSRQEFDVREEDEVGDEGEELFNEDDDDGTAGLDGPQTLDVDDNRLVEEDEIIEEDHDEEEGILDD